MIALAALPLALALSAQTPTPPKTAPAPTPAPSSTPTTPTKPPTSTPPSKMTATVTATAAWIRLPPPAATTAAGFFALKNTGAKDRKLLSVSDDVAKTTELHTHLHENGVMKMRAVAAVDVKAGDAVAFGPGGLHVMFIDLVQPLREGQVVPLVLRFDDGSVVEVAAVVSREAPTVPAAPTATPTATPTPTPK